MSSRAAKRAFDVVVAAIGITVTSPFLVTASLMIWLYDRKSPIYVSQRVGRRGNVFRILKLRSMDVGADETGVDSTAADDPRLTPIGRLLRRSKIDEAPQFINVLMGEMSVVGPRPNVKRETDLYTAEEKRLLTVLPGITDLGSIVFSDYSEILRGSLNPDIEYNQRIRPWKSRLGLLYVDSARGLQTDIAIVLVTLVAVFSRSRALQKAARIVRALGGDETLSTVASRSVILPKAPPPGATEIVTNRLPLNRVKLNALF